MLVVNIGVETDTVQDIELLKFIPVVNEPLVDDTLELVVAANSVLPVAID